MSNIKQLNMDDKQWADLVEKEIKYVSNLSNEPCIADRIVALCSGTILFIKLTVNNESSGLGIIASILYRLGHKAGMEAAEAKLSALDKKMEVM